MKFYIREPVTDNRTSVELFQDEEDVDMRVNNVFVAWLDSGKNEFCVLTSALKDLGLKLNVIKN